MLYESNELEKFLEFESKSVNLSLPCGGTFEMLFADVLFVCGYRAQDAIECCYCFPLYVVCTSVSGQ